MEALFWVAAGIAAIIAVVILVASTQGAKSADDVDDVDEPTYIRLCYTGTPVSYHRARVLYDDWGVPWIKGSRLNDYPWHADYRLRKNGTADGHFLIWKHISGPEVKFSPAPQDPWA